MIKKCDEEMRVLFAERAGKSMNEDPFDDDRPKYCFWKQDDDDDLWTDCNGDHYVYPGGPRGNDITECAICGLRIWEVRE